MDSLWQQHRTFILKILGGLAVVLVCWIVGANMAEQSLSEQADSNATLRRQLNAMKVPSQADIRAYEDAVDRLTGRVEFLANRIGETRQSAELRRGLIEEILASVNADSAANITRYLELSRSAPVACVVGLRGVARDHLAATAGLENVILPDEVLRIADLEASQADRYLLIMKLTIEVVKMAIEEGLAEVKSIKWTAAASGRFSGENQFVREYPVSIELRGPADAMMSFIARVTGPADFIPIRGMSKCGAQRSERDKSVVTAEFEFMAIRIDPDAGLRE